MKAYQELAPYYDRFMSFIDYEAEAEAIYRFLFQLQKTRGRVLDVGTGSGGHLLPLVRLGAHVDGLDYSEKMVAILKDKLKEENFRGHLFCEDMRRFVLTFAYDLIYCLGETVHHLKDSDELSSFFRCALGALNDNGFLIFSWQEQSYFEELAAAGEFYERHGDDYLLWDTRLDNDATASLTYTAFIREDGSRYRRLEETHTLAIYEEEQIIAAAEDAGFKVRLDLEEICFGELLTEEPAKHITVLEKR